VRHMQAILSKSSGLKSKDVDSPIIVNQELMNNSLLLEPPPAFCDNIVTSPPPSFSNNAITSSPPAATLPPRHLHDGNKVIKNTEFLNKPKCLFVHDSISVVANMRMVEEATSSRIRSARACGTFKSWQRGL